VKEGNEQRIIAIINIIIIVQRSRASTGGNILYYV